MLDFEMVMRLKDIEDVKAFVEKATKIEGNVVVKSVATNGVTYIVDGKSILGLFSLDLSHPITVICDKQSDLKFLNPNI